MKMLTIMYTVTLDDGETIDLKGRSMLMSDSAAKDLYGYEAGDTPEPENLELVRTIIAGLETLEGNTAGEIQSIG